MTLPSVDDVVIRQESLTPPAVYLLGTLLGPEQCSLPSREEAVSKAIAYAKDQHVRAWFAKGDGDFVLLGTFRDTQSVPRQRSAPEERAIWGKAHPHTLLIGSDTSTTEAIAQASRKGHLRVPLMHWHPSAVWEPPQAKGTLVIWEIDALDRMQQSLLLAWMNDHAADLQVVSVARRPIFPLVLQQEFLDALYYRLNPMCLTID